jgi:prepilin signal peptidase PulO-like enzyme (type II secretory pathway)
MAAAVFFLLAIPCVFIASRIVLELTSFEEDLVEDSDGRRLPWQAGPWPDRVRWAVLALLPPAMAVAGARFDVLQALAVSLLVAALLVCTATDLLRFRVPNAITYPGTVLALGAAILMPDGDIGDALLAAFLGGGMFCFLALLTGGGIGLGDAKLAALIGAALGLPIAYQALLYGVVAAALVMVVLFVAGVIGRKQAMPYAPFLSLAAIAMVLLQGTAFAPL